MLFNNKHIDRYAATFEIKNVAQLYIFSIKTPRQP